MNYTTVELKIIKYCEENAGDIYQDTIKTLAEKVYTSPSTISKLTRKMGYNSFIEFKLDFQMKYGINHSKVSTNSFIDNYTEQLDKSLSSLDLDLFIRIKEAITNSEEVLLFGIGSSAQAAKYLKNNLLRLNITAMQENNFYSNTMQLHARAQKSRVTLIIFSHSGNTSEVLQSLEDVDTTLFEIIVITSDYSSKLAKLSDIVITYETNVIEKSPFSNWSYIVQIAICDILLNELTQDIIPNIKLNSQ